MADCSGDWNDSKIEWTKKDGKVQNPPLKLKDGNFTINPHSGSNVFKGRHRDPKNNVTEFFQTNCTDSGTNKFKITMRRRDLTTLPDIYVYEGNGTILDPKTGQANIKGTVTVHGGGTTGGDTGTWETSRPGTGGDEDDKDKKDRDKRNKDRPNQGAVDG